MKLEELKCLKKEYIDLNDYINFIKCVKENMEYPQWLGDFTNEELESPDINLWVYFLDREIVCSMMSIKSSEKSCEKFEINHDYKEVIDYGQIAVNPNYIGHGLQLQMLKYFDDFFRNIGYKYIVTTVHPDNIYCINNLLKDNFILHKTKEFKRGKRNIYIKEL